jgi:putative thioredoxin
MTQEPIAGSAGRGAVDLSGLSSTGPGAGAGAASGGSAGGGSGARRGVPAGLVIEATDATFTSVVNASLRVPSVVVLWSPRLPQTADYVDLVTRVAADLGGRLQVVVVDADANPGLLRAFQVQSVPVTIGLVQGQPVPLFAGALPEADVRATFDELLKLAVQHGVAGRLELGPVEGDVDGEDAGSDELPPLHQQAFDAIEAGDFDGATAAYEQALRENPNDHEAQLGRAQVGLLRRTAGVDLQQARAAAAADPTDIDAALTVADLDVLGGHVEDAFGRLLELVRATAGDDRDRVRTHLIGLFAVVGNHDERVKRGRTALMSALF